MVNNYDLDHQNNDFHDQKQDFVSKHCFWNVSSVNLPLCPFRSAILDDFKATDLVAAVNAPQESKQPQVNQNPIPYVSFSLSLIHIVSLCSRPTSGFRLLSQVTRIRFEIAFASSSTIPFLIAPSSERATKQTRNLLQGGFT